MGFLKKIVKRVKKTVKKVAGNIKKVVKKISKSKLLKTIALVGAAIVTGGAAIGAFGGTLASSAIGSKLVAASKFITGLPVIGTVAKPFQMIGTAVGTGAGKVTDVLGMGDFTGRAAQAATEVVPAGIQQGVGTAQELALSTTPPPAGQINMEAMNFGQTATTTAAATSTGTAASTAGTFARGTIAGDVVRGVGTSLATGAAMQYIQGEPDPVGALGAGLGEERGINLAPLEVAYAQAGVDMNSIYNNLTFGTADPGFLASRYSDLYQQPTLSLGG
tara:strand:- start:6545 stop:7372 length:828 start_codon:yes stop_codon:yes gene_type:complete